MSRSKKNGKATAYVERKRKLMTHQREVKEMGKSGSNNRLRGNARKAA